jgi:hypothetical protein
MLTNPDFIELLKLLAKHEVRYLVVGGYAVMRYSEPRFTKDLDLLIAADPDNAARVYAALVEFGAPLKNLTAKDFEAEGFFYQMGRAPVRVDVLMSVPGVRFAEAWPRRDEVMLSGVGVPFISKADLIRAKRAAGRPQDLLDLDALVGED